MYDSRSLGLAGVNPEFLLQALIAMPCGGIEAKQCSPQAVIPSHPVRPPQEVE